MKPQKALHLYQQLEKKNPKLHNKQYMMFEKYDGWYGYLDYYDVTIMSRQMRAIPSLKWLSDEIAYDIPAAEGRWIFEICVEGSPVFKDLNGILNRQQPALDAYLLVHDFIPKGEEDTPFYIRYRLAQGLVRTLDHPRVRLAPVLHRGTINYDLGLWQAEAERLWSMGCEGTILKDANAPYSPGKRNSDILKIKLEHSEEMLVIGAEQGEGKYEGTLGALLVKDQYNVIHRVSGMSDEERHAWWNNLDIIVGKVVEVKFMCRLANGSIREGRFKAVRYDKTAEELG